MGANDAEPQKWSENSEYRPLCSGPAHWIPACAGMTKYCLYCDSTRPKVDFQATSQTATPSSHGKSTSMPKPGASLGTR